jgi:hypothetical protein
MVLDPQERKVLLGKRMCYQFGSFLLSCNIALVAFLVACNEPYGKVTIREDLPPVFKLTGSGNVSLFFVRKIHADGRTPELLWDIRPQETPESRLPLQPITYGILPPGFVQTFPAPGTPPHSLVEGQIYEAGAPPVELPGAIVRFTVQHGRIKQL